MKMTRYEAFMYSKVVIDPERYGLGDPSTADLDQLVVDTCYRFGLFTNDKIPPKLYDYAWAVVSQYFGMIEATREV